LKKIGIIGILVLSGFILTGQNTAKWLYDTHTPAMSFESTYFLGSPTVTNGFIDNYFTGTYLGPFVKTQAFKNLNPTNILGAHQDFKLSCVVPVDKGGSTVAYYVGVENKNIIDMEFSDNLFKLFFDGNKQFAGDTVSVKDNHMNFLGYSQLKGGLVKKIITKRFQHTFMGVLAFNVGTSNLSTEIRNAKFYTDNEGALLDTEIDMAYRAIKNKSDSKIKFANGLGAGLDLYYNFKCDKGNNFSVALNDIGFVRWLKPYSSVIEKDTSFVFEGIEIKEILDIDASTEDLNKDSIKNKINELIDKRPYTTILPMTLQLYFYRELSKRIEVGAGLKHVFNTAHKPYYFVDAKFYLLPQLLFSPTLSYGGYSGFNAGLDVGLNIRQFNLYFGSDYVTPFFDNEQFRGKGYYLRIVRKISYGPKSFETAEKKVKISKYRRAPKYNANIFSNSIVNKISQFNENDSIFNKNDSIKQL